MFHKPSLTLGYNPVTSNIIIHKITLPLTPPLTLACMKYIFLEISKKSKQN